MARQAVSKYLPVLEAASLVTTVQRGAEAVLSQRGNDQRHRRALDQPARPRAGALRSPT